MGVRGRHTCAHGEMAGATYVSCFCSARDGCSCIRGLRFSAWAWWWGQRSRPDPKRSALSALTSIRCCSRASSSASSASIAKLIRPDALNVVRRHPLILAYVAALIPALAMAVTQPLWSLVDEAQHADFIIQLSHGVYPAADRTLISAETLHVTESTGVFRAFYPAGSYPTPDLSDVGLPPPGMSVRANAAWMRRHMWQLSHESVQTPIYYVVMVPVWWAADRLGGPFAAIYALRIINTLIVATLAPTVCAG